MASGAACYIFGASPFIGAEDVPDAREGDFIIAADGGLSRVRAFGLNPDLICGDFDSLREPPEGAEILTLPCEKDETDMFRAVREGFERGYRCFYIYGGLGGRLDHTLANIQTLLWLSRRGARGFLRADGEIVTIITNGQIDIAGHGMFSVLACCGEARGVSIAGAKYELNSAALSEDFPCGVSNEFTDNTASIRVEDGSLVIVVSR
ncbi:MAG: thiamine diphosphokinase [Oscillospiraceae bacterium]|jgi:thiamine pyrophosphokinase|nr:thiamine diphosphokinase [Oscillospiraceae bacterium]